jgi:alcohol dehydrogenase (cytochrome c)
VRALDDRTGKVLWETRVNDVPGAFPISYMVDGKQYIAMPVGDPGMAAGSAATQVVELRTGQPPRAPVLWVWELP